MEKEQKTKENLLSPSPPRIEIFLSLILSLSLSFSLFLSVSVPYSLSHSVDKHIGLKNTFTPLPFPPPLTICLQRKCKEKSIGARDHHTSNCIIEFKQTITELEDSTWWVEGNSNLLLFVFLFLLFLLLRVVQVRSLLLIVLMDEISIISVI